jgi:hypothetical protein
MYQILFPEGQIECARYEESDHGVTLHDDDGEFIAFVPYSNLHAVIDEETAKTSNEPSVM